MTNMFSLTQEFFRKKVQMIHIGVLLEIIAMVIIYGRLLISGKFTSYQAINQIGAMALLVIVVFYVELSVQMEKIWVRNVYRLIPISDTRFYFANLISNILTYAYFLILQGILLLLPLHQVGNLGYGKIPWEASFGILLVLILTGIFGWVFITMVNFLVKTIKNFMPAIQQTFAQVVLSILAVAVVVYAINGLVKLMNYIFGGNTFNFTHTSLTLQLYTASAGMFLLIMVMIVINVFLLKRIIDTKITTI